MVVLYVRCGVMWGAREGMHFSQSKNARLLNLDDKSILRLGQVVREVGLNPSVKGSIPHGEKKV